MDALLPFMRQHFAKVTPVEGVRGQAIYGDYLCLSHEGHAVVVEVKAEQRWTGNLFIETWSNYRWRNPGWSIKCEADELWYYFQDARPEYEVLYVLNWPVFKVWAFEQEGLRRFKEVRQERTAQKNVTFGCLVNIDLLQRELPPGGIVPYLRQGEMFYQAEAVTA